jgi:AP-2 complex subunit alpha
MPPWSDENETSGDLRVDEAPIPDALPVGNLLDLETVPTTPQYVAKPSWVDELTSIAGSAPTGPPLHPLASLEDPVPSASAPAPILTITPSFHLLSVISEGLLFEDSNLRIGMKSQYQKSRGRMMFFFTNASNSPLTNVTVNFLPYPAIAIQTPTTIAPTIEPGQLAQHLLHMISVAEFQDFPVLQVTYL